MWNRLFFVFALMVCFDSSYKVIGSNRSFIIEDCNANLIVRVMEDRCYIEPDAIHVSREGIFLIDGNEMFPIAQLEADENGVFFRMTSDYEVCPSCRRTKVYGKCRNRDCPRYGIQVSERA